MAAKSSKSWQRNRGQALQRTGGQALETMAEIMARRGRKSWPGNHGPEIMARKSWPGAEIMAEIMAGRRFRMEIMATGKSWPGAVSGRFWEV